MCWLGIISICLRRPPLSPSLFPLGLRGVPLKSGNITLGMKNIPFKSWKILSSLGILHQVHEAPQVFEYYLTTKHNFLDLGILLQLQESFLECRNSSLSQRFPFLNLIYFLNQETAKSEHIAQVWESMRKGLVYSLSLKNIPVKSNIILLKSRICSSQV